MGGRFEFRAIGVVHSPFVAPSGTPIQPTFSAGAEGVIEVEPPFVAALSDLEGFERIWVLYAFDRAVDFAPLVVPYRDDRLRGLFATRAPARPNPIGLSALRLLGIAGGSLRVGDVDILDGTPVLDIKPYVPAFDAFPGSRAAWLDERRTARRRADDRFAQGADGAERGGRARRQRKRGTGGGR